MVDFDYKLLRFQETNSLTFLDECTMAINRHADQGWIVDHMTTPKAGIHGYDVVVLMRKPKSRPY